MTAQSLDPDQARQFVASFETMLQEGTLPAEAVEIALNAANLLPEDDRDQWIRRWKSTLFMAVYGTRSRSTAYYLHGLYKTANVLAQAGLVDMERGFRDCETGRKVKSLVGELSRVNWADDDALVYAYRDLRDEPLDTVKDVVRLLNPRVQTLDITSAVGA